jgi:tetratricopeptide (TPR) repeat protein
MDSRVTCWECASCGKALDPKTALMCMGCRKVVYCGLACATAHFKEHMEACFLAVCARVKAGDVHKDDTGGEYVLKQYIKRARRSFGDQDVRTVEAIDRYATFLQYIGRLKEAEPLFREALAGVRATLGPKHPNTLLSMNNLAQLLQAQGKLAEAEAQFKETLVGLRAALGPQHPHTLTAERSLAQVSQQRKGGGKK